MEFRAVEAFLAVAEELHFGRAAARLHVTTTRVSQNVRSLERHVGGLLFERSTRRVSLTPLGERLLADLRPAYQGLEAALRNARETASPYSARLRVAFATSMSGHVSTTLVDSFQRRHPDCQVERSFRAAWALHTQQTPGWADVDIFITWAPGDPDVLRAPGCTVGPALGSVPRGLLVAKHHPLAGRTSVDIEELAGHPLLHMGSAEPASDRMDRYADAWNPSSTPAGRSVRRVRRLHGPYMEEIFAVIAEGQLAHITIQGLTDAYQHQDATIVPLTGVSPMLIVPIWHTANHNPMVNFFIRANAGESQPS